MTLSPRAVYLQQQMANKAVLVDNGPTETRGYVMGTSAADRIAVDLEVIQELEAEGLLTVTRTVTYYELVDTAKLELQSKAMQDRIDSLQAELDQLAPMKAQVDAQVSVLKAGPVQEAQLG